MRKMITCSFDENGVVMTAWNGVHPDRPGHFSVTKLLSREDYNEACKNKHLFDDILGIKVHEGWAQALSDATKNASDLKINPKAGLNILMNAIIMKHGPEKAKEIFESLETENISLEAQMEKLQSELDKEVVKKVNDAITEGDENGNTTDASTDTGKSSKKSGRKAAVGTSDAASTRDAA